MLFGRRGGLGGILLSPGLLARDLHCLRCCCWRHALVSGGDGLVRVLQGGRLGLWLGVVVGVCLTGVGRVALLCRLGLG